MTDTTIDPAEQNTDLDTLGPVDYLIVEFPAGASNFTGEMAKELLALVDGRDHFARRPRNLCESSELPGCEGGRADEHGEPPIRPSAFSTPRPPARRGRTRRRDGASARTGLA